MGAHNYLHVEAADPPTTFLFARMYYSLVDGIIFKSNMFKLQDVFILMDIQLAEGLSHTT